MEVARHWARGELTTGQDDEQSAAELDDAMGFFGLVPDGPAVPATPLLYLWPENVEAWEVFQACGTQWRTSPDGREGLDYAGVRIVMCDIVPVPRKRRQQRMREIHLMEVTALNEWALKRRTEQ